MTSYFPPTDGNHELRYGERRRPLYTAESPMTFFNTARVAGAVNPTRYPAPLRVHWLVVVLVVLQFSDAWTMPHIGRGTIPVRLIAWHLFFGTTIR